MIKIVLNDRNEYIIEEIRKELNSIDVPCVYFTLLDTEYEIPYSSIKYIAEY